MELYMHTEKLPEMSYDMPYGYGLLIRLIISDKLFVYGVYRRIIPKVLLDQIHLMCICLAAPV